MNTIKVYEDESKFIEVSNDDAEILTCKQLLKPISSEYLVFIYENFEYKFFKNEIRQELFKIGQKFWKLYEKIPSETNMMAIFKNEKYNDKKSELEKEYKNIINFKEEDYSEKYVKDTLIKFTKMRKIYFTMLEQFEDIEQNGEIGDCLGRFEKIVQLDMMSDLGIEYFSNLDNHCNELIKVESRQPFGFKELDRMTYGGMPTSDTCLFVIMAQPGLGKSQLMMNIAYNWIMANKKVLMISLEMSEDMYSRRMDGLFADLNINKLRENVGLLKSKIKAIKLSIPKAKLRIKEFPTGTCSAATIKQFLKKLKIEGFEPDLICVDYLNIMKPSSYRTGMNLYEKCGAISEELRAISSELKIPIITATQASRSAGGYAGADIDIANVSESSGITATADALVALFQLDGEREQGIINLKILKNRLGGYVGTSIKFGVNYETLKFSNFEDDEDQVDEIGVFSNANDANDNIFQGEIINDIKNVKKDDSIEDI